MSIEYKALAWEDKSVSADGIVKGYASVSGNVDQGGDLIEPGAFADMKKLPKMLWQHDPAQPIGVWEKAVEDSKGLYVEGRILTELSKGAEVHTMLKNDLIDGMSIGYRAKSFEYKNKGKEVIRHLKSVELFEVSIVTFPMNPKALVTDVKQLQTPREVETILREAGVPAAFAKLVASHGFVEAKARLAEHREDAGEDEDMQLALKRLFTEIRSLKEHINGKG